MKHVFVLIFIIFLFTTSSCKKEDCRSWDAACKESPPTNEICLAHFNRWFYNEETKSCQQKAYSGCSPYGFASKEECEKCDCS